MGALPIKIEEIRLIIYVHIYVQKDKKVKNLEKVRKKWVKAQIKTEKKNI